MLTTAEITQMQTDADEALPESASVYRATETSDSMGGFTISETLVGSFDCRVDAPGRALLEIYANRIGNRIAVIINFPAGSEVAAGDRISIDSVDYELLGILEQDWEITRRVMAVRQA